MASNVDLTLRLLFEDKASSGMQKFGKTMVGALSVGAIAAFGVASVKAFADAEAAQNKLAFAFQKFPAMSNISLKALQAFNTELMKKTGIDDDAIASGQAVLAQFKLTGQQIKDVTPLLLDYALATGKDIPDAAEALGKASLGNTRALKELGISYKSTGNSATDFANITQLLRDKVGGFAEQEAQTAAGSLRRLQTAYENVQEQIGGALAPALASAADGFQSVTDQLEPMLADLTELTTLASSATEGLMDLTNAAEGLPGAMNVGLLDAFGAGLGAFVTGMLHADDAIEQAKADMEAAGYTFDEATQTFTYTGNAASKTATHFGVLSQRADDATASTAKFTRALDKLGGKALDVAQATSDLKASYDDAMKAAKDNGKTLDLNTEAGRANAEALRNIATQAKESAQAYRTAGKSADYISGRTKEARQAFIAAAVAMGASRDRAQELADKYGLIPKKVSTAVTQTGAESVISAAQKVKAQWQEIINLPTAQLMAHYGVTGRASGGPVVGPGTSTSDSVPMMLSTGEWVMQASAVRKYGAAFMAAVNDGRLYGMRRGGGPVSAHGRAPGESAADAIQRERDDRQAMRDYLRQIRQEARQARLDAIEALNQARDDAKANALDLWNQWQDAIRAQAEFVDNIREGFRAAAGVGGYQFADTGAAQSDLFDARRAYNQAKGTSEEAAALERLNAAKKAAAEAERQNTPAGVLASVREKLAKVQSLGRNLAKMRAMGYPDIIVRDILNQGIDGAQMAEVLASAGPDIVQGFQQYQTELDQATGVLGGLALALNPEYGQAVATAQGNYVGAQAILDQANAAVAAAPMNTTVQIQIDGRKIVEALVEYKRSIGGVPLGLS